MVYSDREIFIRNTHSRFAFMSKWYRIIPVVLFLLLPTFAFAAAKKIIIEEKKDGVVIRVKRAPLGDVLQVIQEKTGINFQVADTVLKDRIRVNITAPDWKTGIKQLLATYDRLELWNEPLELSNIHILSGVEGKSAPAPKTNFQTNQSNNRTQTADNSPYTRSQLQALSRGKLRSPMPLTFWDNAEYQPFLKHFGMRKREDLNDVKKAMNIRIRARRMLRELRKKK